jgi:SAM-dependent methyltransferase
MNQSAASAAEGYVTEIPYVAGYYRDLGPSMHALALQWRGFAAPPIGAPLTCLELGCGYGLSTLVHAATNPQSQFIAADILPEHINTAKSFADAAQLTNLTLLETSFEELLNHPLPPCDVITMHGVWSWINDANRARILEIVAARLKPGGIVALSYNTLPGYASMLPLRELMMRRFRELEGSVTERVKASVVFAQGLKLAEAAFFAHHPLANQRIDDIAGRAARYLAHEYFNADWHAFYHAQVAEALKPLGLSFGGSAQVLDNIDEFNIPKRARLSLEMEDDVTSRETIRDYLMDRQFRFDLFVRDGMKTVDDADRLRGMHFISGTPPQNVDNITGQTILGQVRPDRTRATAVLTALAGGPATIDDMSRHPACVGIPRDKLVDTVVALVGFAAVEPALPPNADDRGLAATQRLNRALWERAEMHEWTRANASPVTGSGVSVSREEQLFLLARARGEDPPTLVVKVLRENEMDVRARYQAFSNGRLPALQKLGIGT